MNILLLDMGVQQALAAPRFRHWRASSVTFETVLRGKLDAMATVHLVLGQQGAGKTTYARQLAGREPAVRFSIDEWMAHLFAPDLPRPMDLAWIMERVRRCEDRIWAVSERVTGCGTNVVLDLGFMKVADRTNFARRARSRSLSVSSVFISAPLETRKQRVLARNRTKGETHAFDVTAEMFDFMESQFEPLTPEEVDTCEVVETG